MVPRSLFRLVIQIHLFSRAAVATHKLQFRNRYTGYLECCIDKESGTQFHKNLVVIGYF